MKIPIMKGLLDGKVNYIMQLLLTESPSAKVLSPVDGVIA
jgi:hypothetical protein